jgi:hypothetical protein
MTTIRVDRDVYRELEQRIEGFEDTPNLVLRRLLGLEAPRQTRVAEAAVMYRPGRLVGFKRGRPVAEVRTQTAQSEFTRPILEELVGHGGEARARDVLDGVGQRLAGRLTPADREPLSNGEPRWRVTASFERKNLVERGLLDDGAPRGFWRITESGRRWLEGQPQDQPPGWDLQTGLKVIERVMRENKQWLQEMASR